MKHLVIILILTAISLPSLAMDKSDLLSLYKQAENSDPSLLASSASRNAQAEVLPLAKSVLLPNVSLSANLNHTSQTTTTKQNFSSNSVTLSIVQPLFRKDRIVALAQADDQIKEADANYESAKQGLISRLATSYFSVLAAQDGVAFSEAETKAIARQLDQAQQRFDVGLVAITDVHEAQARHDQARADGISAVNALDNAWETLREIVADVPEQITGMKTEVPLSPPEPASLDSWSDIAKSNNPSLQAARAAADVAKKQVQNKRAGHLPTLDLVGSLSRSRSESNTSTDSDTGTISLQLAVPFYSGGGVNSAIRQASYLSEAAQQNLNSARRSTDRQVRDAYRGVQSSISRVKALGAAKTSAQSALEATEAGFDVGTRTLVDVLNSQRDLFRAKRDFSQSRYDYVLNTFSLLQAAGTLSIDDLLRVNDWLVTE